MILLASGGWLDMPSEAYLPLIPDTGWVVYIVGDEPSGKAADFDSATRGFESLIPNQIKIIRSSNRSLRSGWLRVRFTHSSPSSPTNTTPIALLAIFYILLASWLTRLYWHELSTLWNLLDQYWRQRESEKKYESHLLEKIEMPWGKRKKSNTRI